MRGEKEQNLGKVLRGQETGVWLCSCAAVSIWNRPETDNYLNALHCKVGFNYVTDNLLYVCLLL